MSIFDISRSTTVLLRCIVTAVIISRVVHCETDQKIQNETLAAEWLVQYEQLASSALYDSAIAKWNYDTNITTHNGQLLVSSGVC